jgi:Kdo2-lipid IVA lauroyltransferase/acyltransferase
MKSCGAMGDTVSLTLLNLISRVLGILPARCSQAVGWLLGTCWYYILRIRRNVVFANLNIVFPGQRQLHQRVARGFYRHFCMNVVEFIGVHRRSSVLRDVLVEGMEHYHRAHARGKGVIVVTAHLGNFDLLACNRAMNGVPLGLVSKTLRQAAVNEFWMNRRTNLGVRVFEENAQPRDVIRWLKTGNVLGLVVDQRLSEARGGIPVPFLGQQVWTSPAAARLAIVSGAALLPAMIHRLPGGQHRIVIEPEIQRNPRKTDAGPTVSRRGNQDMEILELMSRISQIVERWIRMYPEQWMWIHRRFKHAVRFSTTHGVPGAPADVFIKKTIA